MVGTLTGGFDYYAFTDAFFIGEYEVSSSSGVGGGWYPIKYLDREGNEVSLDDAPEVIASEIEEIGDDVSEIVASVNAMLERIAERVAIEREQQRLAYLADVGSQLEALKWEAINMQRRNDPRVIAQENENAIAVLMLEGSI